MKALRFLFVFMFCFKVITLPAQIDLKGKLQNQTNSWLNNHADQGIDQGMESFDKKGTMQARTELVDIQTGQ